MIVPPPERVLDAAELGRVHFVGVGGAGMSGIARILLARGMQVSGSDAKESSVLASLRALGAEIHITSATTRPMSNAPTPWSCPPRSARTTRRSPRRVGWGCASCRAPRRWRR